MLEDESGRVRLVGEALKSVLLVTGCIIAVLGTETANGEFEAIDIKFPDLPPQPERWQLSKPTQKNGTKSKQVEDVEMTGGASGGGRKVAIVSGLNFSGTDSSYAMELNLLLEYLLGEALDPAAQKEISQISRLIIAGNSVAAEQTFEADDTAERKSHKKYGYDSSTYNAQPTQLLDDFLADLLPSMPVTMLPGAHDPANASFPQQPVHPAVFPKARAFTTLPQSGEVGWLDTATNPWEGEVDGWRFLGTGGQNVDDIFKYVDSDDRLGMMEYMCRWRCCAPTAPDTLCELPNHDPLDLELTVPRELPLPRRRSVRHGNLSACLLCRRAAGVWDEVDIRTRRPDGATDHGSQILGDERDRAGGPGDARRLASQDIPDISVEAE